MINELQLSFIYLFILYFSIGFIFGHQRFQPDLIAPVIEVSVPAIHAQSVNLFKSISLPSSWHKIRTHFSFQSWVDVNCILLCTSVDGLIYVIYCHLECPELSFIFSQHGKRVCIPLLMKNKKNKKNTMYCFGCSMLHADAFWGLMLKWSSDEWIRKTIHTLRIPLSQSRNTNSPPHFLKWPLYLDELGSSAILAIVTCSLVAIS